MKKPIEKIFQGGDSEEYNIVLTAIQECGNDYVKSLVNHEKDEEAAIQDCYEWLEWNTKNSITTELVDKLHELGYSIQPIKQPKLKLKLKDLLTA